MQTIGDLPDTLADRQAAANLRANLAALREARAPSDELLAPDSAWEPEWVFARDGTLTALSQDERWWSGCSVPTRAARLALAGMKVTGQCGCLPAPAHPAVAREALDILRPEQLLLVLLPSQTHAAVFFRCDDFSSEITRRRLWVVWGQDWPKRLKELFLERPGLPIPTQFIKPKSADPAAAEAMLPVAQQVFAEIGRQRAARVESIRSQPPPTDLSRRRLLALAGSRLRLWDEGGFELLRVLSESVEMETTQYDIDDPTNGTPLSVLLAAREHRAVIAADCYRSDCGGVLPPDQPFITWMTRPRVAAYTTAGPRDRLLVSDERFATIARAAGWPDDRIRPAGWPERSIDTTAPSGAPLLLAADLRPLEPPDDLHDMSSHRLLWEMLADRVARDPFCAYDRADALVQECAQSLGIDPATIALARYIDDLVAPAYAISIAKLLLAEGLPLTLAGAGWNRLAEFASRHAGPVRSRRHLHELIAASSAIVHALPVSFAHPVDCFGRPVVRYRGGGRRGFVGEAVTAAKGQFRSDMPKLPLLSPEVVLAALEWI